METLVRQSRFLHQLVVDRQTSEDVGRVELPWMDPSVHRVLGFICKPKGWGNRRAVFALPQIHILGDDSIVLKSSPTRAELEQVQQLESLMGLAVWSEAGELRGHLHDCVFNLRTGRIVQYLMVPEGWQRLTGTVYQIAPTQVVSYSRDRVMIADVAAQNLTVYEPGLEQKLKDLKAVGTHLKEDATSEWRSLSERAKVLAENAKDRLADLTQQVSEQAKEVVGQASETAQTWGQVWPEPGRAERDPIASPSGLDDDLDDLDDLEDLDLADFDPDWSAAADPAQSPVEGWAEGDLAAGDEALDWTWDPGAGTASRSDHPGDPRHPVDSIHDEIHNEVTNLDLDGHRDRRDEVQADEAIPDSPPLHLQPLQLDLQTPRPSTRAIPTSPPAAASQSGDRPPVMFAPDVPPRSPAAERDEEDEPWV